jgi:AcrR family transcriptional regulator
VYPADVPKVSDVALAQRRGDILAAARRAFARHGYEGATVRVLEAETGLSRGAIFHHFRDKEALFLALAEDDAARTAEVVARAGLVQVMRDLRDKDAGWLGVQLEVRRRLRTDPAFAASWAERQEAVARATAERLERQREAGVVRTDVPVALLVDYLRLVLDGLVSRIASGMSIDHLDGVLDLVEDAVRTPTSVTRIDQRSSTMASQDSFGARSTLDVGDASYEVFRLDAVEGASGPPVQPQGAAGEPAAHRGRRQHHRRVDPGDRRLGPPRPSRTPRSSSPRRGCSCRTSPACRASSTWPPCARRWPTSAATRSGSTRWRRPSWSSTTPSSPTSSAARRPSASTARWSTTATASGTSS